MDPRLETCMHCMNKKFDPKRGIVCNLTDAKPEWDHTCPEYERNEKQFIAHELNLKKQAEMQASDDTMGLSAVGIKNGILAGIIVIIGGIVWLVAGIYYDLIFIYPFILIVFGVVILLRGILKQRNKIKKKKSAVDVLDADATF
jgi:hypothetical protein